MEGAITGNSLFYHRGEAQLFELYAKPLIERMGVSR
jgi:hypothetical protein